MTKIVPLMNIGGLKRFRVADVDDEKAKRYVDHNWAVPFVEADEVEVKPAVTPEPPVLTPAEEAKAKRAAARAQKADAA